ncbi:heat shock protein [Methylophaga lonarensis MPL]|uniref:Heat shock protein n=1 Tax=Methylophaga lonarensis MPL TaxID=1286106 RepID=M7PTP7_9GAMM|nr:META domain-containing protein [Methylophaga lonarensis]EMR13819.1 heat shock protein [Methylophaga lonarensis MPL]
MHYCLPILMIFTLFLQGCQQDQTGSTVDSHPLGKVIESLPASFAGTLPCADCPGIRHQLNLMNDRWYLLRREYLERDEVDYQLGRWSISTNQQLQLHSEQELLRFRAIDASTLTLQDPEGRDIDSMLSYQLTRNQEFEPFDAELELRGNYRYIAGSGLLTECISGQRWPVKLEGDNMPLQRAYMEMRAHPAQQLLVTLNGTLTQIPDRNTAKIKPSLKLNEVHGIWPGETCGQQGKTAVLENTYWKLTRLDNTPIIPEQSNQEAHIILDHAERRMSGSDGCNRLMGAYVLNDQQLRFRQVASTMMACPSGMETAQALHLALEQVRGWRITGQHLQLYDNTGRMIARFEAIEGQITNG